MDPTPVILHRLQNQVDNEDWRSLVDECSSLLPKYPSSAVLWNIFGLGHMRMGNLAGARMAFTEAISLKCDFAAAYLNHGSLCRSLGQFEEALSLFLSASNYLPDNANLLNDIGNLLIEVGKIQDSVSYLKRSVELSPNESSFKFNLANALKTIGECTGASSFIEKLSS